MQQLTGSIRAYPWGSRTLLAGLRGEDASADREAELWYGAHPGSPSTLGGVPLTEALTADDIGARVRDEFGVQLPFLLKILCADEPLSLQAHPTKTQAEAGFAAEEAQGIPCAANNRNYKDDNHKPELIVALTDFAALAGFRPLARTQELFQALDCPELARHLTVIDDVAEHEEANLRALFTTWITIPSSIRVPLVEEVLRCAEAYLARPAAEQEEWIADALRNVVDLGARYPGDIGVLGALLLNKVTLAPGEALYLGAGQLHAYMHGMGVEIMANSDNVLRGGLTAKYVDVPELVKVLDFSSLADPRVEATTDGYRTDYPCPAREYHLARYQLPAGATLTFEHDGPAVVLGTAGTTIATLGEQTETIAPTAALWVPASDPAITLGSGDDGDVEFFIATA
ncbi:mannose-6-phosphate isomerase, class I [Corynebacterium sp. 13CS0277]|uniref:mannose-6-phosphate isomerase, class I n=1 Tax=Corynebacterium sp. 13CS0277 TaxID=2071994 RepID=UPI000D03F17A|nr:mannose-6-phosphate isomerase, class I [Corynebacterium sp. 13CS0277]PRQ10788.1 mannose-6-phosphate isomerase, class I [Corynebacterium sp. 13CS0277]